MIGNFKRISICINHMKKIFKILCYLGVFLVGTLIIFLISLISSYFLFPTFQYSTNLELYQLLQELEDLNLILLPFWISHHIFQISTLPELIVQSFISSFLIFILIIFIIWVLWKGLEERIYSEVVSAQE